ncbi:MAG: alpha/beta fold hydrolase [Clostridia bacterium]
MNKQPYQHHVEIHGKQHEEWLILVHGAGGSGKSWYKQIPAFAEHFRVLSYDLRGHGQSAGLNQHDEPAYSFPLIVQDLLSIMEKYQIKSAHFCGCSLGTVILQELVLTAPDRVKSMVLAGAVTKFYGWSLLLYLITKHVLIHVIKKDILYPLMATIFMPFRLAKTARRLFIRESKKLKPEVFYKWWDLTSTFTVYKRLDECPVPALIVMGEYDYTFLSGSFLLQKKFLHAEHVILPKAGHVCNIDQPQAFNELALAFLQKQRRQKTLAT